MIQTPWEAMQKSFGMSCCYKNIQVLSYNEKTGDLASTALKCIKETTKHTFGLRFLSIICGPLKQGHI